MEKYEENAVESEYNLKALLSNTLQSFILIGRNYRILIFNAKAAENKKQHLGITISVGTPVSELFSKEIIHSVTQNLEACFGGKHITTQYTFRSITGTHVWFIYNFTPVVNKAGEVEAVSLSSLNITAEKNSLLEYIKSENLITSIFNATETGICVTDHQGYFVKVNPGYASIYGYSPDELIGQKFTIVVVPEQRALVEKLHDDFINGKEELPGEWKVQRKDGTLIDIHAAARLLVNPDGTRYKVTTVRDITETKKYKHLLNDTQQTARIGGWELDIVNRQLTWTEEIYKIYGLPSNTQPNLEESLQHFTDESRHALNTAINQSIEEGTPFDMELQLINQNHEILWVRITCKPVQVYNKTIRLFGTFQDITSSIQAADELHKLSLVASKTSNGVIITDKNRKVEWVNEGFVKQSGYTLEEIKGKTPGSLLQGVNTDPAAKANMHERLLQQKPFNEEVLNYRKDGTPYWVNISFTPVFNNKKELTHYIAIETDITERIQKERQLLFQASILENVRDSIIVTDLEGIIIYWNEGATKLFEFTKEEALGKSIHILNPSFDSHDFIENHKAGKNIYGHGRQWSLTRRDGSTQWMITKLNPVVDHSNQIIGILGVTADITARINSEQQLRQMEASLKAIFETSPNAHFLLDKEMHIISFNKVAFESIKRIWHKEAVAGESMLLYSNPPDISPFTQNFQRCLHGELIRFEREIRYTTGANVWYEITYMPVPGPTGEIEGVSFSSMDITSRKLAEQHQRETNKTLADFRYAITAASIVSITDAKGNITYTNDNFLHISQYRREELIGQSHRIINSGYHPKEFFADLWRTITRGEIWRGEIRNKAKDGTYYWVDTFIIPFLDENSRPFQYLSIRNDITNRKLAEQILLEKNKELEKTNAELDRFVYSASHNLRAPLTSIMGLLNIIQSADNPEYYLSLIGKSVKKLDDFIKDIVVYSKNSRLEVEVEQVDFKELVESGVEDLRFMKDAEKIRLHTELNAASPFYSDTQRLKVVFGNLLSNAIKYHNVAQEDPYVRVTITSSDQQANITIEDNGIGIASEHHEKLFSMFYRATTRSEGSGLGLYIVKEIIEKLEGTIRLESEPGKGTTFHMTLPNLQRKSLGGNG